MSAPAIFSLRPALAACLASLCSTGISMAQGPLIPPGDPAPTMKTLDQIFDAVEGPATPIRQADIPLIITEPGSYRLVETIQMTTPDQSAITITVDEVFLDLNGFPMIGPGGETGTTGSAISSTNARIRVRDGAVIGWRGRGVLVGANSSIQQVQVKGTGEPGIEVGPGSIVALCAVKACFSSGIVLGDGSAATRCASRFHDGGGFIAGNGCTLTYCAADNNGQATDGHGFEVGDGCVLVSCNSRTNSGHGVSAGNRCVIRLGSFEFNDLNGIETAADGLVESNVSNDNNFDGISVGERNRVVANLCVANDTVGAAGIRTTGTKNVIMHNCLNENYTGLKISAPDNYSGENFLRQNLLANEDLGGSVEGTGDRANVTY